MAPDRAFINNVQAGPAEMEAARFADPAWLDYRLQSDSPLRGAGIGGRDRGPGAARTTRVFYVGPAGDDAASGMSVRLAFRTFARAASVLLAPGAPSSMPYCSKLYVATENVWAPVRCPSQPHARMSQAHASKENRRHMAQLFEPQIGRASCRERV